MQPKLPVENRWTRKLFLSFWFVGTMMSLWNNKMNFWPQSLKVGTTCWFSSHSQVSSRNSLHDLSVECKIRSFILFLIQMWQFANMAFSALALHGVLAASPCYCMFYQHEINDSEWRAVFVGRNLPFRSRRRAATWPRVLLNPCQ